MSNETRYADLTFDPVRKQFADRHLFMKGERTEATLRRLGKFAQQKSLNPDRLTLATSSIICEFLGITEGSWRWMMNVESNSPLGPPPPPRAPGGPRRGRGVADMWILELDIVPWLLATSEGTERLGQVIDEINGARFPSSARSFASRARAGEDQRPQPHGASNALTCDDATRGINFWKSSGVKSGV